MLHKIIMDLDLNDNNAAPTFTKTHRYLKNSVNIYRSAYMEILNGKVNSLVPAVNFIRMMKSEKIAPTKSENTALDFGCGDGRHCIYLAKQGYKVVGTDVSKETIELTKKLSAPYPVDTLLLGLNDPLPLKNQTMSLIISWETLHWLGSKENFVFYLNEFKRVLKPNGSMILTMPTERHFIRTLSHEVGESQYLSFANSRMNCLMYSPNLHTLQKIFSELGLKTLRIMSYDHCDDQREHGLTTPFSMYVFHLQLN